LVAGCVRRKKTMVIFQLTEKASINLDTEYVRGALKL